jgi:hypothetical protein
MSRDNFDRPHIVAGPVLSFTANILMTGARWREI